MTAPDVFSGGARRATKLAQRPVGTQNVECNCGDSGVFFLEEFDGKSDLFSCSTSIVVEAEVIVALRRLH